MNKTYLETCPATGARPAVGSFASERPGGTGAGIVSERSADVVRPSLCARRRDRGAQAQSRVQAWGQSLELHRAVPEVAAAGLCWCGRVGGSPPLACTGG